MDTKNQFTKQNSPFVPLAPPPPSPPPPPPKVPLAKVPLAKVPLTQPHHKNSKVDMKINQKHKLNIIPEMEYNKIKNFTSDNIKDNLIINPHIFIFIIITLTLLIIMLILYEYGYINSNMDI